MDPLTMFLDGWCNDCECDPATCIESGKCKGEKDENICTDT